MSWLILRARMCMSIVVAMTLLTAMFVITGPLTAQAAGPNAAHAEAAMVDPGEHDPSSDNDNADRNEEQKRNDRSLSLRVTFGAAGLMLVIVGGAVLAWVRSRGISGTENT